MALGHASMLGKLNSILALQEAQPVRGARDGDAKEVVERPRSDIMNSELRCIVTWRRRSNEESITMMSSTSSSK